MAMGHGSIHSNEPYPRSPKEDDDDEEEEEEEEEGISEMLLRQTDATLAADRYPGVLEGRSRGNMSPGYRLRQRI